MTMTSTAFGHGGDIPREHTCDGADTSPALAWSGVPEGTKSLALIVDDPDAPDPEAPKMTYVHWVLYDMPSTAAGIASASRDAIRLPAGTREGTMTGSGPATAGHARRWGGIATSSSSTPSTPCLATWATPASPRSSPRWRGTCSRRQC